MEYSKRKVADTEKTKNINNIIIGNCSCQAVVII